jgi:1-deoxy-D-xylulose-5-phosphate reductoisomerase
MGGTAPAVLNAADEIAVQAFLERKISFSAIPKIIAAVLDAHAVRPADSLEGIMNADSWARTEALRRLE